jgi:hypothetical protein
VLGAACNAVLGERKRKRAPLEFASNCGYRFLYAAGGGIKSSDAFFARSVRLSAFRSLTAGTNSMPTRLANVTQAQAKRLFKAAASAGVTVEFRPDGTIVANPHKPAELEGADATSSDSAEEVRKLI